MSERQLLLKRVRASLAEKHDPLLHDVQAYLAKARTVAEAGKAGGEKVKQTRGPDYYSKIGAMGGKSTQKRYGSDHYSQMGRKGGRMRRNDAAE